MSERHMDPCHISFYDYEPSQPLCIVAAALFGATLLVITTFTFYFKEWRRMAPFVLGVMLEVVGYALRWFSANDPYSRPLYIATLLLIVLAPVLMAASEYMIFGYLLKLVGEQHSPIRAGRVTAIFVFFDILSLVVQGGGAGLFASNDLNVIKSGRATLIVGLGIQLVAFSVFWVAAMIFQWRLGKAGIRNVNVDRLLHTLFAGCVLILCRSFFRCVEFMTSETGVDGRLAKEEYYYSLEALPVLLACIIFCASFPGLWLRRLEIDFKASQVAALSDPEKKEDTDTVRSSTPSSIRWDTKSWSDVDSADANSVITIVWNEETGDWEKDQK